MISAYSSNFPQSGKWHVQYSCAAVLLVISILSGQFSIDRILPVEFFFVPKVKVISLFLAFVFAWPYSDFDRNVFRKPLVIFFVAVCACFLLRGVFDRGELGVDKAIDIVILLLQMGLLTLLVGRPNLLQVIGYSLLICAGVFLCVEVYSQYIGIVNGKPVPGFGWGNVIGSISFNRIQFLGFCVALVFLFYANGKRLFHIMALVFLASLYLFATWGSLQKAALGGSGVVVIAMLAALIFSRHWKATLQLSIIVVMAFILTQLFFMAQISTRLDHAVKQTPTEVVEFKSPKFNKKSDKLNALEKRKEDLIKTYHEYKLSKIKEWFNKSFPSSFSEFTVEYCYYKSALESEYTPDSSVNCYRKSTADLTSRMTFWIEALRGFVQRPLLGNGLASYKVVFISPYDLGPEIQNYPHNLFFETAFETGVIGLTLILIALVLNFKAAVKNTYKGKVLNIYILPILGFATFMFFSISFSGDFYDSRLMWQALLVLAVASSSFGKGEITKFHQGERECSPQ